MEHPEGAAQGRLGWSSEDKSRLHVGLISEQLRPEAGRVGVRMSSWNMPGKHRMLGTEQSQD